MKCPNCDKELAMTERNGVEIDYCPSCRGVWLDRGELDKIIERSAETNDRPHKKYDDDDYKREGQSHQQNPHKKKRGSFLGDLFDF